MAEVQLDEHGRARTWELSIPELQRPMRTILDCPERLFVAWHRHAIGINELLDENGCRHGHPPQADLWEVREYRRIRHWEGYAADYVLAPRVGDVLVAARSKTGRLWRVVRKLPSELWLLYPIGDDVSSGGPQENGKWSGGVRAIRRGTEELTDQKRWRRVPRA